MCCSVLKRPGQDNCLKICQTPSGDCVAHLEEKLRHERATMSSRHARQLMSFLLPLAYRYI